MRHFISLLALGFTLNANIILPENFRTDFQQTITNDKGKVIKYDGQVLFKNQHQISITPEGTEEEFSRSLFKWSYTSPTQKEVCTDGIQLIVVDHDLEQVSNYLINDSINLEEILKIANALSKTTYQATYKDVDYLITMDAKEQLKQIVYVDNLDNKVKIIFKNMNYNAGVDEQKLECHAPDEYDIIKG